GSARLSKAEVLESGSATRCNRAFTSSATYRLVASGERAILAPTSVAGGNGAAGGGVGSTVVAVAADAEGSALTAGAGAGSSLEHLHPTAVSSATAPKVRRAANRRAAFIEAPFEAPSNAVSLRSDNPDTPRRQPTVRCPSNRRNRCLGHKP